MEMGKYEVRVLLRHYWKENYKAAAAEKKRKKERKKEKGKMLEVKVL
jgi:hypothetical protein